MEEPTFTQNPKEFLKISYQEKQRAHSLKGNKAFWLTARRNNKRHRLAEISSNNGIIKHRKFKKTIADFRNNGSR